MGHSIRYPLAFNARGGLATTDDNLQTIIVLSLLPGLSANPYNDRDNVGGKDHTWEPNSAEAGGLIAARVDRRFRELERQGRARLTRVYWRDPIGDPGVLQMVIDWVNLETGTSETTVLPDQV